MPLSLNVSAYELSLIPDPPTGVKGPDGRLYYDGPPVLDTAGAVRARGGQPSRQNRAARRAKARQAQTDGAEPAEAAQTDGAEPAEAAPSLDEEDISPEEADRRITRSVNEFLLGLTVDAEVSRMVEAVTTAEAAGVVEEGDYEAHMALQSIAATHALRQYGVSRNAVVPAHLPAASAMRLRAAFEDVMDA